VFLDRLSAGGVLESTLCGISSARAIDGADVHGYRDQSIADLDLSERGPAIADVFNLDLGSDEGRDVVYKLYSPGRGHPVWAS
jgi:hypothetical protein